MSDQRESLETTAAPPEAELTDDGGVGAAERESLTPSVPEHRKSPVREVIETVVVALLIALLIRQFVVEVFVVDGRSMEPTLFTSERLLVNKFVYRFRTPQPGEIIVFRYPRNQDRDFIKRVVAVAGDRVEIRDGYVYVNDQPLPDPYVSYRDGGTWPEVTVPPGAVWVLGDNRNNSEDSRYFGEVPLGNIKGRAFFRFWPIGRFMSFAAG